MHFCPKQCTTNAAKWTENKKLFITQDPNCRLILSSQWSSLINTSTKSRIKLTYFKNSLQTRKSSLLSSCQKNCCTVSIDLQIVTVIKSIFSLNFFDLHCSAKRFRPFKVPIRWSWTKAPLINEDNLKILTLKITLQSRCHVWCPRNYLCGQKGSIKYHNKVGHIVKRDVKHSNNLSKV